MVIERIIRRIYLLLRKRAARQNCFLDKSVRIDNYMGFETGKNCAVYHGAYIQNRNGKVVMGENSHLGAFCYLNTLEGNCIIGDHVSIGPGTKIIVYSNHYEPGRLNSEIRIKKDIKIGNNVFIGANCTILPGAVIEDNVVVGAGTVVLGQTLTQNGLYCGVPAQRKKNLE